MQNSMNKQEIIESFENLRYFESTDETEWERVLMDADIAIKSLKTNKYSLNNVKNYVEDYYGVGKIGGSGCDKDEKYYGANDNVIIELIYKKFVINGI